jgi:hypothetical protein
MLNSAYHNVDRVNPLSFDYVKFDFDEKKEKTKKKKEKKKTLPQQV